MNDAVRTTCPYCGVGCGVLARRLPSGEVRVAGDPDHPANRGRLCSKGSALGETVGLEGRLLHARVHGERTTVDAALDHVASKFRRIIDEHGPQAVALYVSGQLLTEDYYLANKLMKGYIGTANIDTNSRLCMSSSVAGHKRAFGEDIVPGCYEDLELADLVVMIGWNAAWCHPVLFQRISAAKQSRPDMKIVVIDPRRTATCELADLHLPVRGGTDVWLFNGLLSYLRKKNLMAPEFVAAHTSGLGETLAIAEQAAGDLESVARVCGVDASLLAEFYQLFSQTERTVSVFSQGVNQSSAGTDKVNSIINCHLLTGRIGKPGMGPFSITGQPNAMGGREAGGLANMLAAHMELQDPDHRRLVQQFWNSPRIADRPGLKAVDLFEAIHRGDVKAVWIMATNPVVSMPDADRVKQALQRCELVVVSDCVENTATNEFAHVLLPAAAWGEKDGTVTNSERRISRQRAFLPLPGDAKPDWWLIDALAQRLGYADAFDFNSSHEIFVEHARLSGFRNDDQRAFDISGLAQLDSAAYDALSPVQWPLRTHEESGAARLTTTSRFYHPDRKARFIPTTPQPPVNRTDAEYPLVLNTGRIRDQWHTMTRSGRAPTLSSHTPEPFVDMHAQDALLAGVRETELVRVETRWGALTGRLRTSGELARGTIFVPIHWSGELSSDARVGALVNPIVDPISGEPELKHTPARVKPFVVEWYGFALTRQPLRTDDLTWWTLARGAQFLRYEIAGRQKMSLSQLRSLLGVPPSEADWLEYSDPAAGTFRGAWLHEDKLDACVFISSRPDLPSRSWLSGLFAKPRISANDRSTLLTGKPLDAKLDAGPVICSCFGVGQRTILDAITQDKLSTTQAIGQKLRAGTNCGSCVPEIRRLLRGQTSA